MSNKKIERIVEFAAGRSNVTSCAFSNKSNELLSVGGDDGSLNFWHVKSTNCIMQLPALNSPVTSIQFDKSDDMICVGARSGCLRIYNLQTSKVLKTLAGHKASVNCIDFHPYGDFLASCSDDHKVRMWDVRRKGCIYTYKDHTDQVNEVQFSPDGKWIASTSDDNTCKIWDLTAGKLLHELKDHSNSVKCLQFHPREFLLATGGMDRTANVYDVEQFKMLTSTPLESNSIVKVAFAESGDQLYTISQDCFKMYSYEPQCVHLDTVLVKWGRPVHVKADSNYITACSFNHNIVCVNSVDVNSLNYTPSQSNYPATPRNYPSTARSSASESKKTSELNNGGQTYRKAAGRVQKSNSYSRPAPDNKKVHITRSSSQNTRQNYSPQISRSKNLPNDDIQIFEAKKTLPRSPNREVAHVPPEVPAINLKNLQAGETYQVHNKNQQNINNLADNLNKLQVNTPSEAHSPQKQPFEQPCSSESAVIRPTFEPLGGCLNWNQKQQIDQPQPSVSQPPANQSSPSQVASVKPQQQDIKIATVVPMERNNPCELDMNAFLPAKKPMLNLNQPNDGAVIQEILKGSNTMQRVLKERLNNVQVVRAMWTSGSITTAVNTAVKMTDQSLIIDLLNVLNIKPSLWSLDLCNIILPSIKDLIISKYETYVNVGCDSLRLVLKNFSQVIKSNLQAPPHSAIDINREERHNKCRECHSVLLQIKSSLDSKQLISGKLGSRFRELKLLISSVE